VTPENYLPLVRRTAGYMIRAYPTAIEYDDLVGAGQIGLVEAWRRYDGRRGDFDTFASSRIRGAMLDAIRRAAPLSRADHAKGLAVERPRSLNEENEGGLRLLDMIVDPDGSPEDVRERIDSAKAILRKLTRRQAEVALGFADGATGPELAARIGVSEGRVSQIRLGARRRLEMAA